MEVSRPDLARGLSKQWGWFALRGALAVIFAFLCFTGPIATAWALTIFWGAFVLVQGIVALTVGWRVHKSGMRWWPYLLFGLLGIVAALVVFLWPQISMLVLVYLIAFWAIFGGISEIVAAIRLRKVVDREWALVLSGFVSVVFGFLVLIQPFEGLVALVWLIGFFTLCMGIISFALAWNLRKHGNVA